MSSPPAQLALAREEFFALVDGLRPELHRYASRLVGSAIEGEDVVQDTLAKALYALSQATEVPPLRPWLFRITRNTALDHLRRYDRRFVDALPEGDVVDDDSFPSDPSVLRVALGSFLALPVSQRTAVILKDVLDEPLGDIAIHMGTTVEAVKALLVRGRATLRQQGAGEATRPVVDDAQRALVQSYVSLFNAKDWTGVQALLLEECRLDLVSKSQRQGKSVRGYFGRYAEDPDTRLRTGTCEGRDAIGVYRGGRDTPDYVVLLETDGAHITFIRDFRYVPYLIESLEFLPD
jgi:RNA polymerase sigma-70 factor (ECF subfamily)